MSEHDSKNCIVVIGDIMLDEYVFGTVDRVSPESCCPILKSEHKSTQLGGAANVAYQIRRSGKRVLLSGIIGKDQTGEILVNELSVNNIDCHLVFPHNIPTTKKTRFVNDVHQQMFRVDKEVFDTLTMTEVDVIVTYLNEHAGDIESIVLSDYNKGVLTEQSCQSIIKAANAVGISTIVDIKEPKIEKYKDATVIKGNQKEISSLFNSKEIDNPTIEEQICIWKQTIGASAIVITLGKSGIVGVGENNQVIRHHANQVMVYDVTGAGDIVTAYIGQLYGHLPFEQILYFANKAAELKVTKFGNSYIPFTEVSSRTNKVVKANEISSLICGKKVVFTNGCFDILHAGHIDLLQYAKTKGDVLVVGLNSDASVRRLKGNNRPINNLEMRLKVLSAIDAVDYIVCFDDDTPEDLIRRICPDALVKGGDYTIDTIVGADYVLSNGGTVETMPFHYSQSTTNILSSL